MSLALAPTDLTTASTYLRGAVDVTLRNRFFLAWLDKEGRINREATGKDLNWQIEFKEMVAQPYTPMQQMSFNNDNFNIQATVSPEWFYASSGMDVTEVLMNSGPTVIMNNYKRRVAKMARSMQILLAKSIYSDAASSPKIPIGMGTFCRKHASLATTTGDRLAPPIAGVTYAGLDVSLGAYGGDWSSSATVKMNAALAKDWPDGQGDPSNAFDATSPRLYNENTNRWADPAAVAAASSWRTNCISMISRANTDLRQNSVDSMMPNIHMSGSERHQAVKDAMRTTFRDTMVNRASHDNLGYYQEMDYEGAVIHLDHECPANRTYSVNSNSVEYFFYGSPAEGGGKLAEAGLSDNAQAITGGIFTTFGPERPGGTGQYVWIMLAGGNSRWQPRWVVCHSDFVNGGG